MTKIVVPYMKKQGNGLIINVNSTAGVNWKSEYSVYTAAKAIKFMVDQDDDVVITDLGIKHIYN